jgi:hypothetical protein
LEIWGFEELLVFSNCRTHRFVTCLIKSVLDSHQGHVKTVLTNVRNPSVLDADV